MGKLTVFRSAFVTQLKDNIGNNTDFYTGSTDHLDYEEENTLLSRLVDLPDQPPYLSPLSTDDTTNAIKVYEYLPINGTQASDARLWVYMTHVTFKEYTASRWPIKADQKERVLDRWFLTGSARGLRRNAISRLWWATHLTVAPWETDEYFADLENEDRYVYTRAFLHMEDATSALMERRLGWSRRVLITLLEYMRTHEDFAYKRVFYRNLLKEVNLTLGYRKIMILSFDELYREIESIASDILARPGMSAESSDEV